MNNTLKQVISIVIFIFFAGYISNNSEITKVLHSGLGMILICAAVIMGIGSFFPLNISIADKFICFFWAGALFILGAGLHMSGFFMATVFLSLYILAMAIFFAPLIEKGTQNFLLALGGIMFLICFLFTFIDTEKNPSITKALSTPTEKPTQDDNYNYPCVWCLYGRESGVNNPNPSMFEINFGYTTGTLEQAKLALNEKRTEWEKQNYPKELMNATCYGKDIYFERKIKQYDEHGHLIGEESDY